MLYKRRIFISFLCFLSGSEDAWPQQKQACHSTLLHVSYRGQNAMRVNDVSNQSLYLTPADDLPLQMTGEAAFQQGQIDISSRRKLLPSIAKSWSDTLGTIARGEIKCCGSIPYDPILPPALFPLSAGTTRPSFYQRVEDL